MDRAPRTRGRRESRASNAPAASYAKIKSIRASHHRFTGTIRPSLRNGFTAYFVLSLVTGLVVTITDAMR
jgi:hypothetical protein